MTTPLRLNRNAQVGREPGFTLIELLVVIIILGILSAVVVFAVRGIGDKGEGAAVRTDERTIRTAEEIHCAQFGSYTDGAGLVAAKLLSDLPQIHTVTAGDDPNDPTKFPEGNCPSAPTNKHYKIACTDGSQMPGCGVPGVNPPPPPPFVGNPAAECGDTQGWCLAIPPVAPVSNIYNPSTLIQLSTGKVLAQTGAKGFALFDPDTNTWSAVPPPTSLAEPALEISTMIEITGTACPPPCGKVLVHFGDFSYDNVNDEGSWQLLDLQASPGTWLAPPTGSDYIGTHNHSRAIKLPDSGACTFQYCGKILVLPPILSPLPDGKVLLNGYQFDRETKIFDPNPDVASASPFTQVNSSPLAPDVFVHFPPAVLPDGSVLQIGSYYDPLAPEGTYPSTEAQIYRSGEWIQIPSCRQTPTGGCYILASLEDGKVLAHAGSNSGNRANGEDTRTFLFDPDSKTWKQTGSLNNKGTPFSGVLIDPDRGPCGSNCGKVLAAGHERVGIIIGVNKGTAELYSPPT